MKNIFVGIDSWTQGVQKDVWLDIRMDNQIEAQKDGYINR